MTEGYETDHIRRLSDEVRQSNRQAGQNTSLFLQTTQLLTTASFFGVLALGGLFWVIFVCPQFPGVPSSRLTALCHLRQNSGHGGRTSSNTRKQ